jgi:hypothetical protein
MYGREGNGNIKRRKVNMTYRIEHKGLYKVVTTVTLLHGKFVEFLVDKMGVAKSMAIPKKEILTMRYDPQSNELFYDVELILVTETDEKVVNKTFRDTFAKIEKIASEKLVPVINAIED